jgi:hypothetical protein
VTAQCIRATAGCVRPTAPRRGTGRHPQVRVPAGVAVGRCGLLLWHRPLQRAEVRPDNEHPRRRLHRDRDCAVFVEPVGRPSAGPDRAADSTRRTMSQHRATYSSRANPAVQAAALRQLWGQIQRRPPEGRALRECPREAQRHTWRFFNLRFWETHSGADAAGWRATIAPSGARRVALQSDPPGTGDFPFRSAGN